MGSNIRNLEKKSSQNLSEKTDYIVLNAERLVGWNWITKHRVVLMVKLMNQILGLCVPGAISRKRDEKI